MGNIKKFEDLICWQKARTLNKRIYEIVKREKFDFDYEMINQIRRCGISIVSNIAEGFERDGNKEFISFLSTAKASAGELRAQLYLSRDLDYLSEKEFTELKSAALEVSKIISGLMNHLKQSEIRGRKFK